MPASTQLHGNYDYGLVFLSLIIAISASYVALELAGRMTATRGRNRSFWLAGGSISMGLGIWSMHYIGMLAFSLPVPILYDLPMVFVSLLAGVLASAVALLVVSRPNTQTWTLIVGSVVMGGGIAAMHYIGMDAMRMEATHHYNIPIVILSVAIAIIVSAAALFISLHLRREMREFSPRRMGGAVIMGCAIASMHYTGMAAVEFSPGAMHGDVHGEIASAVGISSIGTAAIASATIVILVIVSILAILDRRFTAKSVELRLSEERGRLLQIAKEAAEAASDAKTTFLATMSHEIRTPMNALMGLQELLSLSRLTDDQRDWVRLMRQSSKDLLHLIDDILDFSKIEAGKLEIRSEPTAVRELVQGVCDTFSVLAREKGLKLHTSLSASLPSVVMADPFRLRQILSNLVNNAIKFTHDGNVHVRATASSIGSESIVEFEVVDTGIGMSQEVVDRCGEPFRQADAGMARRYGGSGLGLAICNRLCKLMQGSMRIESIQRLGTRIVISLPLTEAPEELGSFRPDMTQSMEQESPARAMTVAEAVANKQLILVVDDHPTNRRLLVQQLEWLGFACEAYGDGRSALTRYVERLVSNTPYAVTITDCQMPDMDGYELAREIRRAEVGLGHRTALLAFTADTSRSVTELTSAIGFDAVLSKPVNLVTLKTHLDQLLPRTLVTTARPRQSDVATLAAGPLQDAAMRDEFFTAHQEDLEMLNAGELTRDTTLIARAAHRIRGAARMIGLQGLADAATALGHSVPGNDWDQIGLRARHVHEITQELYKEFEQLKEAG